MAGVGFRTNRVGLDQLQQALAPQDVDVIGVDLPFFRGPGACLHLMSVLSMVDHDLAVVYPRLLPVAAWKAVHRKQARICRRLNKSKKIIVIEKNTKKLV